MENQNENQIIYQIEKGDNLYRLAKKYHTTVEYLMNLNPHLDPYHLQIGDLIMIINNLADLSTKEVSLSNKMRMIWEQHVYWTRLAIISILAKAKDQDATTARLLQSATDLANLYKEYYGGDVANEIERLFTEHITIAAEIVTALRDGDTQKANQLTSSWYDNAADIAKTLASINPYYDEQALRRMLNEHLDMTIQEIQYRMNNDYEKDVANFNDIEQEALMMADYLLMGITNQFPNQF